jgi:hypothetical protein
MELEQMSSKNNSTGGYPWTKKLNNHKIQETQINQTTQAKNNNNSHKDPNNSLCLNKVQRNNCGLAQPSLEVAPFCAFLFRITQQFAILLFPEIL